MQQASKLFSESDRQRINECVRLAEAGTSAEIVPVVATSSGGYDRAEDVIGLWLGVVLMIVVSVVWPAAQVSVESGAWDSDPLITQPVKLVAAVVVGFLVGASVGARAGWLRRLFTPVCQMVDEVRLSARSTFFDKRVHHTQPGGGLLIYISLFEQVAVILADHQIVNALGQPAIDELCESLTLQFRECGPTEAICKTIQAAGVRLHAVLPGAESDVNELPDSLVTID